MASDDSRICRPSCWSSVSGCGVGLLAAAGVSTFGAVDSAFSAATAAMCCGCASCCAKTNEHASSPATQTMSLESLIIWRLQLEVLKRVALTDRALYSGFSLELVSKIVCIRARLQSRR